MKVKAFLGTVGYTLKKFSPEILLGLGITGVVGGTVLACKATLKYEEILDEHREQMEKVEEALELADAGEAEYSIEEANKDRRKIMVRTAFKFVKLYGPSASLMATSIGCILCSYRIISKRNVALMAAYKVLEETFNKYRGRVIEELGEARDAHFMYGTETVEDVKTTVDENGKKKKVVEQREEIIPGANLSGFARMFEPEKPDQYGGWHGSTQWSPVHDYNLSFLTAKEQHFNDQLVVKGFVTINDVYSELGFPCTEAGMVCGWRYKSERGDGYISFRPFGIDGNWATGKDGDPIVLDFNIDGVIFDQSVARKELKGSKSV